MKLSMNELDLLKKALQRELAHVEEHSTEIPEWLQDAHTSHLTLIKQAMFKLQQSALLKQHWASKA